MNWLPEANIDAMFKLAATRAEKITATPATRMVVPPAIDPVKIIEQLNQIATTISGHRRHMCGAERLKLVDDLVLEVGKTAIVVAIASVPPQVTVQQ